MQIDNPAESHRQFFDNQEHWSVILFMFQFMFLVSCWSVPLFAINTSLLNLMRSAMIFRSFFFFSHQEETSWPLLHQLLVILPQFRLEIEKKYLTLRFWADIIFFILAIIVICCCFFFLLKWIDKNRHCRNSDHGVRSGGYYSGQVAAVLIFSTLLYILAVI